MKRLFTPLLIASTLLSACNSDPRTESHHETEMHESHADEGMHEMHETEEMMNTHDTHESVEINLNDGMKWKVNPEMKPHLEKGKALLDAYVSENGSDYKTLARQLSEQNNALIQSCTMKGSSHDELHKWLHPHLELVAELSKAKEQAEAEEIVSELQSSYDTYQKYFQ